MNSVALINVALVAMALQSGSTSQPADGWATAAGSQPAASRAAALSRQEQERYDRVAVKLLLAMKAEDAAAYRALHSDEGWSTAIDWWQAMFAQQRARFGPITRAYPGVRGPIRFDKFGYESGVPDCVAFVVRFEERVGGVLAFRLNDAGKIVATSVFIKEELRDYQPEGVKPIFPLPKP